MRVSHFTVRKPGAPGHGCGRLFAVVACLLASVFSVAGATESPIAKIAIDDAAYLLVERADASCASVITVYYRGEAVQSIMHASPDHPLDPIVEDYNLDGHMDFSLFGSLGAASAFREVYLFDHQTRRYVRSAALSDLPCVTVDAENRFVIGACFHNSVCENSVCENWQEAYTVSGFDNLDLARRWGTECCPASEDCYYLYDTRYRDGEIVSEQRTRRSLAGSGID